MHHWYIESVDITFLISCVVNALLFVPQMITLHRSKQSKDVSFTTFFGFLLLNIITVLYGGAASDSLLMYGYILSVLTNAIVVFQIIWYRKKEKTLA